VGLGPERVAQFVDKVYAALKDPLTSKEKETGLYTPPPDPRICFTGTYDDAQAFYQKTTPVANCRNCPMAQWTDGSFIQVPTEQKVKEILTGTKHPAVEQITRQINTSATATTNRKGSVVTWYANNWAATVEKVGTIGVMAGCKPEYMPVLLAMASSGSSAPSSNGMFNNWQCVSGPIAKEIGMSGGQGAWNAGNPANCTLGRAFQMMVINFGGMISGMNRTDFGSPWNKGTAFAEDVDGLPAGWEGLNEEGSYINDTNNQSVKYKKTESIVQIAWDLGSFIGDQHAPSSFRALNSGNGGMAVRLGVQGKPGHYNFLEYYIPELMADHGRGAKTFFMHPNMCASMLEAGFKTKADVYQWVAKSSLTTAGEYKKYGWWDFETSGGNAVEPTSGKKYNDLPDDYPLYFFGTPGSANTGNCIICCCGPGDEICMVMSGRGTPYPIDPWR
jgi:hypothetical protein